MNELPATPNKSGARSCWLRLAATGAVVLLWAIALLAARFHLRATPDAGRAAFDQNQFHLPVIRTFAAQWPHPDLHDYASATTPGYHLLLAATSHYIGSDLGTLKCVNVLISLGLLVTLTWHLSGRVSAMHAIALSLPLVASLYVFTSAFWLLPDNAGWWCVLVILLLALSQRTSLRTFVATGIVLVICVLIRQSHLWTAAVVGTMAWLGAERPDGGPAPLPPPEGWQRRLGLAALATLPAIGIVAYFLWLWHGPVPPSMQQAHSGGNLAAPAAVLSVAGGVTLFMAGYLWPALAARGRSVVGPLFIGAVIGLIAGAIPQTDYNVDAGRWSGLWNAVNALPTIWHRSPLVVLASALGGAALAAWAVALPMRKRWIFLMAWLAFIAAQSANAMAWQRYYEPMALMMAAVGVAHLETVPSKAPVRFAWAGPLALSALLAAITAFTLG